MPKNEDNVLGDLIQLTELGIKMGRLETSYTCYSNDIKKNI